MPDERGGRYFGGKRIDEKLGTTVGGEIEPTEVVNAEPFAQASSIDEMIAILRQLPETTFIDNYNKPAGESYRKVLEVIKEGIGRGIVLPKEVFRLVSGKFGLRESVVRVMSPSFIQDNTFADVMPKLRRAEEQNQELVAFRDITGKPLSLLKNTSGDAIDIANYIKTLENIIGSFGNQYPPDRDSLHAVAEKFTSSQGFRGAVKRSIENALAAYQRNP
ncbi:MAG TPA: hypothetical protein VLK22_00200 [Candidatus Udaeobacter sp.]|nr:hypothetical protein [Candidatus Udaeobacter sp.]